MWEVFTVYAIHTSQTSAFVLSIVRRYSPTSPPCILPPPPPPVSPSLISLFILSLSSMHHTISTHSHNHVPFVLFVSVNCSFLLFSLKKPTIFLKTGPSSCTRKSDVLSTISNSFFFHSAMQRMLR